MREGRCGARGGSVGRFVIGVPTSNRSLTPSAQFRRSRDIPVYALPIRSGINWEQVRLPPRAKHMKTSGMPDDLLLLLESGEHRRSPTQAKKKAEIAGHKNYFFEWSGLVWSKAW